MVWVKKSANGILTSGIPDKRTPGFWNNVSQSSGSAGVAQFFLDLYGVTKDPKYLDFARKMTDDLMVRATRDERGTRWVQAENRAQPDNVVAQTGYMQGAAGIGTWLLRLDLAQKAARLRLLTRRGIATTAARCPKRLAVEVIGGISGFQTNFLASWPRDPSWAAAVTACNVMSAR